MLRSRIAQGVTCLVAQHPGHRLRGCLRLGLRPHSGIGSSLLFHAIPQRHFSSPSLTDPSGSIYNGTNATYLELMREQWLRDPTSVHASWDAYFKSGSFQVPPSFSSSVRGADSPAGSQVFTDRGLSNLPGEISMPTRETNSNASTLVKFYKLYRSFGVVGYKYASLDPLGLQAARKFDTGKEGDLLDLATFGLTEAELNVEVDLSQQVSPIKGLLHMDKGKQNLLSVFHRLKEIYTTSVGYEYMHIPDTKRCNWIRDRIETVKPIVKEKKERKLILQRLMWSSMMEQFLHSRFSTHKRFGLEGTESFIPGMKHLIDRAAGHGTDNVVIGMPHRGRLNVLINVLKKPMEEVLAEFSHTIDEQQSSNLGSGDVKYHLGCSLDRLAGPNQTPMHISLLANPSHLEAVNPVVLGKAKAKADYSDAENPQQSVLPLLLHGDAAFQGQGVIYETFGFSHMENYGNGGTIHLVVNNQIGFTCDPVKRPYTTDIAKAVEAPIFHVNADDPEAVVRVMELAADYRAAFQSDVVVDLIGYRKFGHNEIDEPSFTQPLMYEVIRRHPDVLTSYTAKLISEGVVTQEETEAMKKQIEEHFERSYEIAKSRIPRAVHWMENQWRGIYGSNQVSSPQATGVDTDLLRKIGELATMWPKGFNVHKRLKTVLEKRKQNVTKGENLQWADGEAMGWGSLLLEGYPVRISGQDVERGTFSHRHAVLHDQKTGERHVPLRAVLEELKEHACANKCNKLGKPAFFLPSNSHLSEYAVLGFELGYSLESPHALVQWEAQFGDFANTAQVIIDQFISAGEDKWLRQTSLCVLLPHGYEGMGPEHSSARFERFLSMTKEDPHHFPDESSLSKLIQNCNWQIVNCTTPANYFHVLRRQMHRQFRKPLIVLSPKSLLRHPMAVSSLDEMGPGTSFQWLIPETDQEVVEQASTVKRVVFCTGKVYYDLLAERIKRQKHGAHAVALIRLEQIAPFPWLQIEEQMKAYPAAEFVWAQEEPVNMGAWSHVEPRLRTVSRRVRGTSAGDIIYVGREAAASTATGYSDHHTREQTALVDKALL